MGDNSKIEWCDASWSPIRARNKATGKLGWHCAHVSPGCVNCYAEGINTRLGTGLAFKPGHEADVDIFLDETMLLAPLRWRKPRRIFVCSMTDLFADFVPDAMIDKLFAVMALAPQHVYQCLTKRSARMRAYCSDASVTHRVAKAMDAILVDQDHERDPGERWAKIPEWEAYEASTHGNVRRNGEMLKQQINPVHNRASITLWRDNVPTTVYIHILVLRAHRGAPPEDHETRHRNGDERDNRLANLEWASRSVNQQDKVRHGSNGGPARLTREQAAEIRTKRSSGRTQQSIADEYGVSRSLISMIESGNVWADALSWPLANCWLGVSAEDQQRADERIPDLLATPAAIRFVSAEPLLSEIDFERIDAGETGSWNVLLRAERRSGDVIFDRASTPGTAIDWIITGGESGHGARGTPRDAFRSIRDQCARAGTAYLHKQNGEWIDADEWLAGLARNGAVAIGGIRLDCGPLQALTFEQAAHLAASCGYRFEHQSDGSALIRVGKKAAGRRLDGVEHNGFPETRR